MLRNKSNTLLVISRDRILRADFASPRAEEPAGLAVADRPDTDDAGALTTAALGLLPGKPGRVFVLTADAWTHTLELPTTNVAKLPDDELRQMLGFEAEPLSGHSAFETTTSFLPLGDKNGSRTFWVTQFNTAARDAVEDAVRLAGGKLGGLLHPGGMPWSLAGNTGTDTAARVEFWPGAAVRVATLQGAIASARVDDSVVSANWIDAAEQWKTTVGVAPVETLVAERGLAEVDPHYFDLADEAVLRRWLAGWNRALAGDKRTAPTILAPARPMTPQQRNAIALVLTLIVFGACYGHNRMVTSGIDAATAEQTRLEAPGKELAEITKKIGENQTALKKDTDALAKLRTNSKQIQALLAMHRTRLPELLRRLSSHHDADWFITSISGDEGTLRIRGSTTHPANVTQLTATLSREFWDLGWGLGPAEQSLAVVNEDNGLWVFELQFHDVLYDEANPAPHAIPLGPTRKAELKSDDEPSAPTRDTPTGGESPLPAERSPAFQLRAAL